MADTGVCHTVNMYVSANETQLFSFSILFFVCFAAQYKGQQLKHFFNVGYLSP